LYSSRASSPILKISCLLFSTTSIISSMILSKAFLDPFDSIILTNLWYSKYKYLCEFLHLDLYRFVTICSYVGSFLTTYSNEWSDFSHYEIHSITHIIQD